MLNKPAELLNPGSHISLPNSFENMLLHWPELKPLLESFANQDPGTFMHSVAVHFTANRLTQDLFLLLKPNLTTQNEIFNRSPFWMLHDIGKTAASTDKETAQTLVHPYHLLERPAYDKARHWIHPQMGADLLTIWAKNTAPNLQPLVKKWAQLTCLHDRQLNPFLDCNSENLAVIDKLSLLIFSLADTSMAMGLPRPNKNSTSSTDEVRHALHRKYLQDNTLIELFPQQNLNQLRHYIVTSVLHSLQELKKNYPESVWIKPSGFSNQSFKFLVDPNSEKTKILDDLVVQTWQENESIWEKIMVEMDLERVF